MSYHELKILPEYYNAIARGEKTFEVRFNDRGYKVHDILRLREHSNGTYSGRWLDAEVTYLLDDTNYCKEGYVVLSIKIIQTTDTQ